MSRRPALPTIRLLVSMLSCVCAGSALAQQDFGAQQPQQQQTYPQQQQAPQQYQQQPMQQPMQQQPQQYPQQQPMPSQGQMPPAGGPNFGRAPAPVGGNALQALIQQEQQDFGVPPQQTLQAQMHGPTPTSIPGGQLVTTDRLIPMLAQGQNGPLVFHVLGPGNMLPGAQMATPASQAGTFDDQTQREFGQYLQQVTQGDKAKPLVFYCLNTQCWMSYNAALRAINMGFTNVMWYRGGIEAWTQAQQMAGSMQMHGAPAQGGSMQGGSMQGGNGYR